MFNPMSHLEEIPPRASRVLQIDINESEYWDVKWEEHVQGSLLLFLISESATGKSTEILLSFLKAHKWAFILVVWAVHSIPA